MSEDNNELQPLVQAALAALGDAPGEAIPTEVAMQPRFFELMMLILGNLYTKTPVASALFDRATLLRITTGMDDNDAGRLAGRTEDWLRLEGLLRQQDGAKAYFATRQVVAVLSTLTEAGPLGEVLDRILRRYQEAMPSEALRVATRKLGAYFMARVA